MEDTLRYFFSSVFQGFAAIITLGIMSYLYYMDKQYKKIEEIEKALLMFKPSGIDAEGKERLKYFLDFGIVEYMREYTVKRLAENSEANHVVMRVKKYDSIMAKKNTLSSNLKVLFKIARFILIISLISLFMLGYYNWLNTILAISGVFTIMLSILFFNNLFTFSKKIIDEPF